MKNLKVIIPLLLVVCIVVAGFYFLSNRETNSAENTQELSEVQEILAKDFTASYPSSPRMVVNYYSRILSALYNEEYTDEEFDGLIAQLRELMSDELQEANPQEEYKASMEADVLKNQTTKRKIRQYTISDTDEVHYSAQDGKDYASLKVDYRTSTDGQISHTYQEYLLEQDDQGNWKIYGYQLTTPDEEEE
jgi:hypothetical protein